MAGGTKQKVGKDRMAFHQYESQGKAEAALPIRIIDIGYYGSESLRNGSHMGCGRK